MSQSLGEGKKKYYFKTKLSSALGYREKKKKIGV